MCGLAVLPLKCKARGPAANIDSSATEEDQVDEALRLFRANVLFRNFEVQGSADRTLIYLTLLIHQVRNAWERRLIEPLMPQSARLSRLHSPLSKLSVLNLFYSSTRILASYQPTTPCYPP